MAKPTVYMWTDPGAPTLTRSSTFAELEALFRACLIDGYGDKSPPVNGENPWSIEHYNASTGTAGGFILKQGGTRSRKLCLKLSNMNVNGKAQIQVAEDYTDLNTPVGVLLNPTENYTYIVPVGYSNSTSYDIPWVILATERAIWCQFGFNNHDTTKPPIGFDSAPVNAESMKNGHWFFGDYLSYNSDLETNQGIVYCNYTSTDYSILSSGVFYTTNGENSYGAKMVFGDYNDDPATIVVGPMWLTRSEISGNVGSWSFSSPHYVDYPNRIDGQLRLDRVRILGDGCLFGEYPGLMYSYTGLSHTLGGSIAVMSGVGIQEGADNIYVFGNSMGTLYYLHDGEWGVG